jgi:pimeloyl-ACP methyl ester carboxylesterase
MRHPTNHPIKPKIANFDSATAMLRSLASQIVRGELDPICRREWARDLAERLPAGRFAEIPGVAHTLVFTAPAELAEVSRRFLDSV